MEIADRLAKTISELMEMYLTKNKENENETELFDEL